MGELLLLIALASLSTLLISPVQVNFGVLAASVLADAVLSVAA